MRLQSVKYIFDETVKTVKRFPLATAFCAAAAAERFYMLNRASGRDSLIPVQSLIIGAVLFYVIKLFSENIPAPSRIKPWHINLAGAVFMALLYYYSSSLINLDYAILYTQCLSAALLSATFAGFIANGGGDGLPMWHFTRRLATRCFVSAIYTAVLFAGISLAFKSVTLLFSVKISYKIYTDVWIFAAFIFWPIHFMNATPRAGDLKNEAQIYPLWIKLFTQSMLIPLSGLYFIILYVYLGKILITCQWPSGLVGNLTVSASLLCLLTFLLLYPATMEDGNGWIKTYSRIFCAAALPLILMLFMSLYKRIAQYGLTEPRYLTVMLGLWLAGIFLYFILSKNPDIKKVPVSLSALLVLSAVGPWSARSLSLHSQRARLACLLSENGMLANGKAVKASVEPDKEKEKQISATLDYIIKTHGPDKLALYFPSDMPAIKDYRAREKTRTQTQDFTNFLGIEYIGKWEIKNRRPVFLEADRSGVDIKGYDKAVQFSAVSSAAGFSADNGTYEVLYSGKAGLLKIKRGRNKVCETDIKNILGTAKKENGDLQSVPQEKLCSSYEDKSVSLKICFNSISVNFNKNDIPEFESGRGLLLIREKNR